MNTDDVSITNTHFGHSYATIYSLVHEGWIKLWYKTIHDYHHLKMGHATTTRYSFQVIIKNHCTISQAGNMCLGVQQGPLGPSIMVIKNNHWFPTKFHLLPDYFGSVGLSVCLSVCGQHYSTSYERIGMKFYGGVLGSTMKNWLNVGGDLGILKWVNEKKKTP